MDGLAPGSLPPRKSASQARSRATVEAIFEAMIQILVADGPVRLTTTRVARSAGVSVGSLYQYYPNKRSLLFGVLNRQIDRVGATVETACRQLEGQPLAAMLDGLIVAYVAVKTERIDASLALYAVADTMDTAGVVGDMTRRTEAAVAAMFATAPDARIDERETVAVMVMATPCGVVRATFERGATDGIQRTLRHRIGAMCLSYLEAAAAKRIEVA